MYYVTIINAIYADLPEQLLLLLILPLLGWPCSAGSARRVFALKLKKFSLCAVRRPPSLPPPAGYALIYMLNNFCALVRREIVSNASHIKAKYDSALSRAVLALVSCLPPVNICTASATVSATSPSPLFCAFCSCPLPSLWHSPSKWTLCRAHLANQELIKSRSQKLRDLKAEFKKLHSPMDYTERNLRDEVAA